MVKSCVIVLLVAACGVHANVTSTCSHNEIGSRNLDIAIDMISKAKSKIPKCDECPSLNQTIAKKPVDCADVLEMGHNRSGVYEIWPMNRMMEGKHLQVYCDMETDGGGWTVIQRRSDPEDYFYRDWKSYKEGFGDIEKDFWLGNDNLFALTNQKPYSIRFDLKDFENNKAYALYDNFWIEDEDHKYTLHISNYSGNAGDSMFYHNLSPFSTKDQKNDYSLGRGCAKRYLGGWWYQSCAFVNLNGFYFENGKSDTVEGIFWRGWKEYDALAWTEMKIRPKHFRQSLSSEVTLD